jgi:hypothetical protein
LLVVSALVSNVAGIHCIGGGTGPPLEDDVEPELEEPMPPLEELYPDELYPDELYPDELYPDELYPDELYPELPVPLDDELSITRPPHAVTPKTKIKPTMRVLINNVIAQWFA